MPCLIRFLASAKSVAAPSSTLQRTKSSAYYSARSTYTRKLHSPVMVALGTTLYNIAFLRASLGRFSQYALLHKTSAFAHARGLLHRSQPHSRQLHHSNIPRQNSIHEKIDPHVATIEERDVDTDVLAGLITLRRNQD
jgi:uncharacterized protein YqgQ